MIKDWTHAQKMMLNIALLGVVADLSSELMESKDFHKFYVQGLKRAANNYKEKHDKIIRTLTEQNTAEVSQAIVDLENTIEKVIGENVIWKDGI